MGSRGGRTGGDGDGAAAGGGGGGGDDLPRAFSADDADGGGGDDAGFPRAQTEPPPTGFMRRDDTYSARDDMSWQPSGYRKQVLQKTLDEQHERVFETPFEQWRLDPQRDDPYASYRRPSTVLLSDVPTWDVTLSGLRAGGAVAAAKRTRACFNTRVRLLRGSVIELAADGVVNAANETCMGGGGVDGAFHQRAGKLLLRECATFPGCATGQTRITKGYGLAARFCLHTVGPRGEYPEQLRSCYRSILSLAMRHRLRSVGLCCVSTGIFGYPLKNATNIALETVLNFFEEDARHADVFPDGIIFVCFREEEYACYQHLMKEYFPPHEAAAHLPALPGSEDTAAAGAGEPGEDEGASPVDPPAATDPEGTSPRHNASA